MNPNFQTQNQPTAPGGAPMQQDVPVPAGGPQKVGNIGFNQDVQNILLSRIEAEGTKNPNFGTAIDNGVTRDAALELLMILPELKPIFEMMGVVADGDTMGQPIRPPQAQQAQAPVNPGQMPFANRQPQGAEDDDESDNPLTDDDEEEESAPSRGLTGY